LSNAAHKLNRPLAMLRDNPVNRSLIFVQLANGLHGSIQKPWRYKTAAMWLYLASAATAINSIILNRNHRFIDLLVGLSFTQFVDAVFLGLGVEPEGSPDWLADALPALIIDALFVCVLIVLAVRVSSRSRAAAKVALWVYSLDTLLFVIIFVTSIWVRVNRTFHTSGTTIVWQGSTVVVHIVGIFILFHAVRAGSSKVQPIPQ
jgi:hypothetical protein